MATLDSAIEAGAQISLELRVNGEPHTVSAPVHKTLLEVLREDIGLTGTKHGCELGECGTCTVLVDGQPVLSCLALPAALEGRDVTTVEGLESADGLHPLQTAFVELGAAQCGYCTPGFVLAAKALLDDNPQPSRGEIETALGGNVRQRIDLQSGIPMEKAREIVKMVKSTKRKVQAAIQGDQVRISGKKKDELQSIIALLKEADLGIAMQFTNYR